MSFDCRALKITLQARNPAQAVWINVNWVITAPGKIRYKCHYVNERHLRAFVFFSNISRCSIKCIITVKQWLREHAANAHYAHQLEIWKSAIFITTKIVLDLVFFVKLYIRIANWWLMFEMSLWTDRATILHLPRQLRSCAMHKYKAGWTGRQTYRSTGWQKETKMDLYYFYSFPLCCHCIVIIGRLK